MSSAATGAPGYRLFVLAAAAGSAALLAGAFVFQAMGYPPCELCILQRWPHGGAIVAGIVALLLGAVLHGSMRNGTVPTGTRQAAFWPGSARHWALRLVILAGTLAAATTGALGIYHTGIERGWWEGRSSCAAPISGSISLDQIMANTTIIRCDEAIWSFLGLSMASWNAVASFFLAGLWLMAARALAQGRA